MLFQKQGMPQEGDVVFCTVTKVQYHSVFARLDEYDRKSGMIHISEVSPGRIRNINDYVKEGKVVICKVLRINESRGHIDLSLRRVNENQRRAKVEERKHQVIAENILQSYAQL
jgi:translation initiation factor 2 subunit 1